MKSFWIFGTHACRAAILNKERTCLRIVVTNTKSKELYNWLNLIKKKIKIEIVNREYISKLVGDVVNLSDQGIAVLVNPLPELSLERWLSLHQDDENNSSIICMDSISDCRNVGAIIRLCAAFGVKAAIVTDKNSPEKESSLVKTASGAIEKVKMIRVVNLSRAFGLLKEKGYWIYGIDCKGSESIDKMRDINTKKVALVVGNEENGIRPLVLKHCDGTFKIPIEDESNSINVSTATAIALYCLVNRQ